MTDSIKKAYIVTAFMTEPTTINKGRFKGMTITSAEQQRVVRLNESVQRVLMALGHPDAYVTDESRLSDFFDGFLLTPSELVKISKTLNVMCIDSDELIVDIAERLIGGQ